MAHPPQPVARRELLAQQMLDEFIQDEQAAQKLGCCCRNTCFPDMSAGELTTPVHQELRLGWRG